MTLTMLDPNTALVVIDLQKGILAMAGADVVRPVVAHTVELITAFRGHGLPVVLVNVTGVAPGRAEQSRSLAGLPEGWADLIPELNRQDSDILVTKRTWGAFTGTDLEAQLRSRGVTQIVLAGVATSAGVESTARHAHELGFNVTLATDAMADTNAEAHANSITRIFPRLGETGTTEEILALLESSRG
jgi:nicotinamidase-related amidase